MNFPFLTDSLKPSRPSLKQPKSANCDKSFLLMVTTHVKYWTQYHMEPTYFNLYLERLMQKPTQGPGYVELAPSHHSSSA